MTGDRQRALVITKNDFTERLDGGSKRTFAVVRALRKAGYEVDWIAARPFHQCIVGEPPQFRARDLMAPIYLLLSALFSGSLSVLKWFSPRAARLAAALSHQRSYQLLVVEHSQLAPYRTVVAADVKCMDMHNTEAELLANYAASVKGRIRRSLAKFESSAMKRLETNLPSTFDVVATVSERDTSALAAKHRHGGPPRRLITASNGVDDEFFNVRGAREDTVVFIAHLGWKPNVDAAVWLVNQAWPILRAANAGLRLQLIGRDPHASVLNLAADDIEVHPNVPSVLPFLKAARVATAPLLSAGGTRIKILEALAAGTPVVATGMGALGLESLSGDFLRVEDHPTRFAKGILDAAQLDPDRESVSSAVLGFGWEMSLAPLMNVLAELRSEGGRRG